MRVLNEARGKKYGFENVWTYDGRILYKDNIDGQKIKIYYDINLFRIYFRWLPLKWKKELGCIYIYFCLNFLFFSLRGSEIYFVW